MGNSRVVSPEITSDKRVASLMRNVYIYMVLGLALTGFISLFVASNPSIRQTLIPSQGAIIGWIIAEFALVIGLSFFINKISSFVAFMGFILYASINGITLSLIFFAYSEAIISTAFFVSAGLFGSMAFLGTVTKKDLSKVGGIALQLLIGLIIASIVNFFLESSMLKYMISLAGVGIFTALTAYDAWKIKKMNDQLGDDADAEMVRKLSVIGALHLYLDFINIFLFMLRIFGRRN